MNNRGAEHVDDRRRDLLCPECEYSLYGLPGDVVRCPECGSVHDIAALIARRWQQPWYRAPGFNSIVLPVAWLVIGAMVTSFIGLWEILEFEHGPIVTSAVGLAVIGGWGWSMRRAYRRLTVANGALLALLGHAIFVAYVLAIVWGIGGTLSLLAQARLWSIIGAIAVAAIAVTVIWLCRRGEKYIAKQCIRQHLLGAERLAHEGS